LGPDAVFLGGTTGFRIFQLWLSSTLAIVLGLGILWTLVRGTGHWIRHSQLLFWRHIYLEFLGLLALKNTEKTITKKFKKQKTIQEKVPVKQAGGIMSNC